MEFKRHPADASRGKDGMPHDMGGHEGNPVMSDVAAMHSQSSMRDKPAQTHNRHGGNVHVEVGKASARPASR